MGFFSAAVNFFAGTPTKVEARPAESRAEYLNRCSRENLQYWVNAAIEESYDPEITTHYIIKAANRTLGYYMRDFAHGEYTSEMLDMILDEVFRVCAEANRKCPEWAGIVDMDRYPTKQWFGLPAGYTEVQ